LVKQGVKSIVRRSGLERGRTRFFNEHFSVGSEKAHHHIRFTYKNLFLLLLMLLMLVENNQVEES
jgi:hypothetical protein